MSFEDYKGKTATIKSTGAICTIDYVRHKRGADNKLGARFILIDENGKTHEMMPHEITVEQ